MLRRLIAILALFLVLLLALLSWCYSGVVASVAVAEKVVALTYDDGPNPPDTATLLDMLARHGVRATFFLKGRNVEAFPQSARAVALAGHEIGNHSWHHRSMLSLDRVEMREEVERTSAFIEKATAVRPALFRPPYGMQGPGLKLALEDLGLPSILADSNGADWEVFEAGAIADAVLATVQPGSIILLHDGHGDVDDPHAQQARAGSVEATGIIIRTLREQGYRFVTVGELLALAER